MSSTRRSYILTKNPKLYCPHCTKHLRISNLQKKLWCQNCYLYIEDEDMTKKFTENL